MTKMLGSIKSHLHKKLVILVTLIAILCLLWAMVPTITKWAANRFLSQHQAELTAADINPDLFPIGLSLKDVAITSKGKQSLSLGELSIGLDFWPLLTGAFHINHIVMNGFTMQVHQLDNGWLIAGIPVTDAPDNSPSKTSNDEAASQSLIPTLLVRNASIKNISIELSRDVGVDHFSISNLDISEVSHKLANWRGVFDLKSEVNGGAAIMSGDIQADSKHVSADVDIGSIRLSSNDIKHFLPQNIAEFAVTDATLKGKANASYHFNATPTLMLTSPLMTLNTKQFSFENAGNKLAWDAFKTDISDISTELSLPSTAGNINATINLSMKALSSQLNDGSAMSLEALTLSTPTAVNLSPDNHALTLESLNLSLNNADYHKSNLKAHISDFGVQLAQTAVSQSPSNLTVSSDNAKLALGQTNFENQDINVSLGNLILQLGNSAVEQSDDQLSINSQTKLTSSNLTTSLLKLPDDQPNVTIKYDTLDLENQLSWQQSATDSTLNVQQNALAIGHLSLNQSDTLESLLQALHVTSDNIRVNLNQDQAPQLKIEGNRLQLTDLTSSLVDGSTLLNWKDFQANSSNINFDANGTAADIESVSIDNLVASEPNSESELPPLAKFKRLIINTVQLQPDGVKIDSINIDKLMTGVALSQTRDVENLVLPNSLENSKEQDTTNITASSSDTSSPTDTNKDAKAKAPFYVIINTITLSPDSQFSFSDASIKPAIKRVLDINELQIENLNTRNASEKTHILLKAKNGDYATIESDVSIIPAAERLTMTAQATIREVELPPVSPYISSTLGYRINSGQLNMDLDLSATQGELDGNTHIVLRQFDLDGQQDSNSVLKVGAIPLNLAVDALKDRDDNITLDLPMSGDINNPSFQWQSFFLLPIKQGLFKASSTYLMQTFVPYANVISLVQFAGEQVLKLRVEPLIFDLGSSDIVSSQEEFLKQLVALMKKRSGAELKACGFGVPSDLNTEAPPSPLSDEDRQSLLQLASVRSESLKAYLVDAGIASSRVFVCSPNVDDSKRGKPRVELNF